MKTVPLVVKIDGERRVIGSAQLVDDGVDIVVTATVDAESAHLLVPPSGQFSIGESVSERLKREYGTPVATALSMGAWAKEVEKYSNLDNG